MIRENPASRGTETSAEDLVWWVGYLYSRHGVAQTPVYAAAFLPRLFLTATPRSTRLSLCHYERGPPLIRVRLRLRLRLRLRDRVRVRVRVYRVGHGTDTPPKWGRFPPN